MFSVEGSYNLAKPNQSNSVPIMPITKLNQSALAGPIFYLSIGQDQVIIFTVM